MIFLLVLAVASAATAAVTGLRHRFSAREAARVGMAIALAFAGASYLFLATRFIQHLPTWVPLRVARDCRARDGWFVGEQPNRSTCNGLHHRFHRKREAVPQACSCTNSVSPASGKTVTSLLNSSLIDASVVPSRRGNSRGRSPPRYPRPSRWGQQFKAGGSACARCAARRRPARAWTARGQRVVALSLHVTDHVVRRRGPTPGRSS